MATLEIVLSPEAAQRLHDLSRTRGKDESETAALLLSDLLQSTPPEGLTEKELLGRIARGWEEVRWARYHELTKKRRAETLSDAEYTELSGLTDEREVLNAERLGYLIALSDLRGIPLDELMKQLDIPTGKIV